MENFITAEDYLPYITDNRLNQIIQGNDAILEMAEADAIAIVTDHLSGRYDTTAIFATTGDDRPRNVKHWVINLIIYYLYQRIPDKILPERVVFNYKNTLDDLEQIDKGKKSAVLPRLEDEETTVEKTKFRWGSQPARSH